MRSCNLNNTQLTSEHIQVLDWYTKDVLRNWKCTDQMEAYECLTEVTTHYYADKVLNYLIK